MTNFNLYRDSLDFTPRRPLKIKTRSGPEAVIVTARSDDGPLSADVWVVQKNQYSALLNVDLERLPSVITFSLSPATGGAFPVGAKPQVTVQVGADNVVISSSEVGGLSSIDVLTVDVRDDGLTLRRTALAPPPPTWGGGLRSPGPEPSEAAAAAARSAVGAQSLDPVRQRRTVVTVDGSGSMKATAVLDTLERLLDIVWGVTQVASPDVPPTLELSTARGRVSEASPAALVQALADAPFSVGALLAQPPRTDHDGTAYLVISDEVPHQVSAWELGGHDSLQVIVLGDAAPLGQSQVLTARYDETVPAIDIVHHVLRSFPERVSRTEGTPT